MISLLRIDYGLRSWINQSLFEIFSNKKNSIKNVGKLHFFFIFLIIQTSFAIKIFLKKVVSNFFANSKNQMSLSSKEDYKRHTFFYFVTKSRQKSGKIRHFVLIKKMFWKTRSIWFFFFFFAYSSPYYQEYRYKRELDWAAEQFLELLPSLVENDRNRNRG